MYIQLIQCIGISKWIDRVVS